MSDQIWVINVFSSPFKGKINRVAVALIKRDYPAYITTTTVKGKEYMRLRVGFFESRSEASKTGKSIEKLLGIKGSWPAQIGPEERMAFAGY
jgi:cell division septation protein DedD